MFVTPDLLKNLLTSFQCKEQSSSLIWYLKMIIVNAH
jgi:hypothetical protein